MSKHKLVFAILIGAILGIFSGWMFGDTMASIAWIGDLFLNTLKMLIIPLIVAAVISGVASLGDVSKLGKLGWLTLFYYISTTSIAVFIGICVVNIIQPGVGLEGNNSQLPASIANKEPSGISDIINSLVSPNIINAASNMQLLPIIVFCLLFACAMTLVGKKGKVVFDFFDGINEIMMKLVSWVMLTAPIGIFAMLAGQIGKAGGGQAIKPELMAMANYCFTVIIGLAIHFVLLFALLIIFSKHGRNYLYNLLRALLTAFGTASSSATLPLTIKCASEAGVDKRSAKFVLPLGATVNMDGTALYESVAVIFIAQTYGYNMGLTEQIIIFITATLAAVGAAGIPQAGLVTMLIVLSAVNLPSEGIGLILAVDWFLDRFRTTVNVWGDSVGAAILEKYIPK